MQILLKTAIAGWILVLLLGGGYVVYNSLSTRLSIVENQTKAIIQVIQNSQQQKPEK